MGGGSDVRDVRDVRRRAVRSVMWVLQRTVSLLKLWERAVMLARVHVCACAQSTGTRAE